MPAAKAPSPPTVSFSRDYGFARERNNGATKLLLVGRGYLRTAEASVSEAEGHFEGTVSAIAATADPASGAVFELTGRLPLRARYSTLTFIFPDDTERTFNIARIAPGPDSAWTRIHVSEPAGFELTPNEIVIRSFPQRKISGSTVRYRLSTWRTSE